MGSRSRALIDRAFDRLEGEGFDVRRAVEDCSTCTLATIDPDSPRYAYYHEQNVEDWDERGVMHIGFGPDVDAGRAVAYALLQTGIAVRWDGTTAKKIEVIE